MVENIHSYLVHPAKGRDDQPDIRGATIPLQGQLFEMLRDIFLRAPQECDIEICFNHNDDGEQENGCRDEILLYARGPNVASGKKLAARLQSVTTHRSGLGLFFLMKGKLGNEHACVVSRFPADQGIAAEERDGSLTVQFLERVFMRNAKSYKSVIYRTPTLADGMWEGKAIDRQISGAQEVSEYWIRDFLMSQLRTTSKAGTKRFARALRDAVRSADDLSIRQELISAVTLMRRQDGKRVSAASLLSRLQLSDEAVALVEAAFPRADLVRDTFAFDGGEFARHIQYRAVELDNGGVLMAEDEEFDNIFEREYLNVAEGRVRYATEGQIVDERLRNRK